MLEDFPARDSVEASFFIHLQVTTLFLELTLQKTAKKEEKKKKKVR